MATEPELRSAVLASPDADKPRLDYAAWCDRQTDAPTKARGEFIRAHVALARLGDSGDWAQTQRLRHTAFDTLHEHAKSWDADVRALCDRVEYDRGFVELAALPAPQWLAQGAKIRTLAPVRHLDLTGVRQAPGVLASDALAGIRSLRLDHTRLTDDDVEALAASPHVADLRWLSLASNKLTERSGRALAASKTLPRLAYANFLGNAYDPTNQVSHDGVVVGTPWLPPEGERLEARYGELAWLRWAGDTIATLVPDRFRL